MDRAEIDQGTIARRPAGSRHLALLMAGALLLGACEPGSNPLAGPPKDGAAAEAAVKPQKSTRLVDRDVEAPEVFQVTDTALWDGRPSLGGVWVAAPDVKDPERVIMRNPQNGRFVIGALFRRERDNPGPKLQISSDAAEALGLLAGQPARISVTALRREEAPEAAPATPVLDTNESLGPTAVAAVAGAGAIDGGGVETKPLDAPAGKVAGKVADGKKGAKPGAGTPAAPVVPAAGTAAPAGAAAPAGVTPAKPAASTGGRPIQIGFFSVEANARRAVDKLAAAGVTATAREETAQGKKYWTVTARGDAALLKKIRAAGFADAYLLK